MRQLQLLQAHKALAQRLQDKHNRDQQGGEVKKQPALDLPHIVQQGSRLALRICAIKTVEGYLKSTIKYLQYSKQAPGMDATHYASDSAACNVDKRFARQPLVPMWRAPAAVLP